MCNANCINTGEIDKNIPGRIILCNFISSNHEDILTTKNGTTVYYTYCTHTNMQVCLSVCTYMYICYMHTTCVRHVYVVFMYTIQYIYGRCFMYEYMYAHIYSTFSLLLAARSTVEPLRSYFLCIFNLQLNTFLITIQ